MINKKEISMRQLYNEVAAIGEKDREYRNATLSDHVAKLTEEIGEFAKEVNRLTGRKKTDGYSKEKILDRMASEAADSIQCMFVICSHAGIPYDDIKKHLKKNNRGYADYVNKSKK